MKPISEVKVSEVLPLWLDEPDARGRVTAACASGQISDAQAIAARELIDTGFTIIHNVVPGVLCDQVVADFARYLRDHSKYAAKCVDAQGRHLRFVNFHSASQAALELGNTPQIMSLLDYLFARPAGIYTSLFFEYGSQQPIHRDSPFFHTFPINYFLGVWFALEDIHPASGPLMYVPGGHRFQVDHRAIFEQVNRESPHLSAKEVLNHALQRYYNIVSAEAVKVAPQCSVVLNKGDCAIWHPMLPHGGERAQNPMLTRKSMVFHCAPVDLQVYQQDAFFMTDRQPPPRYGFRQFRGRRYAVAGQPCFQVPDDEANSRTWSKWLAIPLRKSLNKLAHNGKVPWK